MSTMRVVVVFEFEDIESGSLEDEAIVQSINEACDTMQVGFDASSCYVEDVYYTEVEE